MNFVWDTNFPRTNGKVPLPAILSQNEIVVRYATLKKLVAFPLHGGTRRSKGKSVLRLNRGPDIAENCNKMVNW